MDVTPQLIEQIDFAEKFRGYDPDQVDDFLERVGATLAELTKTSRDAIARAERAEAELRNAPEASRAPAAAAAAMSDEEEAMQSTRTLMMAKRTADAAIADARQEAQKLVADARTAAEQQAREARTEADRIVGEARVNADQMTQKATAEANREYGARRDQILAEIGELENRKVGMASQLVAIEGRLEEYRSALSSVHGAIGAVLDDPETALRSPLPGIDLAGIARPVAEPAPEPDVAPADVASYDDTQFDAAPYEPAVFAPVADVAPDARSFDARSFDSEPSYAEPIGEPAFTDAPVRRAGRVRAGLCRCRILRARVLGARVLRRWFRRGRVLRRRPGVPQRLEWLSLRRGHTPRPQRPGRAVLRGDGTGRRRRPSVVRRSPRRPCRRGARRGSVGSGQLGRGRLVPRPVRGVRSRGRGLRARGHRHDGHDRHARLHRVPLRGAARHRWRPLHPRPRPGGQPARRIPRRRHDRVLRG
ncbi:MAG: DivIVA domain-containing protein [Microthrixaceae bacterium]